MEEFAATESERACLGAAIIDGCGNHNSPTAILKLMSDLNSEDFTDRKNRELFSIMVGLKESGQPFFDAVAITREASKRKVLQGTDGYKHIASIFEGAITATGLDYHIEEIKKCSRNRQVSAFKASIADMPIDGFMEKAEAALLSLREKTAKATGVSTYAEITKRAMGDIDDMANGKAKGISTGFTAIDKHLGGLQAGDVMIVAGRPADGKSVFLRNCMESAGVPSLFFLLEMSNIENAKRSLSKISGVNFGSIRTAKLSENDYERIFRAINIASELPIFCSDKASMTIDDIVSQSFAMKIKENIGLIGIDYLQLISPRQRNTTREREVAEVSRGLKILAKDLQLPVICLSQLNRDIEKRGTGKLPKLSDLRESGAIEQDADIVAFLLRDGDHDAELFIRKARNAEPARVKLYFDGAHQTFRSVTNRDEGM